MRIGVTGHQDLGDRGGRLDKSVREYLGGVEVLVGISSLAIGADQLFATAVLDLGGSLEVVVPSANYTTTFAAHADRARYASLLSRATSIEQMPFDDPSEAAFLEAGKNVVRRADRILALWDGLEAAGIGGTADVVAYARSRGTPVFVLW